MDYITLMGAEDVQRAGRQMKEAAETIRQATASLEWKLEWFVEQMRILIED